MSDFNSAAFTERAIFNTIDEIPVMPKTLFDLNKEEAEQYSEQVKEWWSNIEENLNKMNKQIQNLENKIDSLID